MGVKSVTANINMALPSRRELLRVAALEALRQHWILAQIDARLGAALKDEACEPDLVTENPECKTALLRAVERADLGSHHPRRKVRRLAAQRQ